MAPQLIEQAKIVETFGRQWADTWRHLNKVTANAHIPSPMESYLASLAVNLRDIDKITSLGALAAQRAAVAQWAVHSLGPSALASWRLSLQVDSTIARIRNSWTDMRWQQFALALELSRISQAHVKLTDWVVRVDASSHLLGEVSGHPLRLWCDQLAELPPTPVAHDLRAATVTGQAGLGLLGADLLTSGVDDDDLADVAIHRVETEVLLPSERGRLTAAKDLYARLSEIDGTVPELLEGAWDDLDRDGPAAASKAAHCVVEALDRTLRAAAPDEAVRAWHAASGRPAAELEGRDRPTRTLRVKFLAQQLGGERAIVVAQYESTTKLLTPLHGRLEAAKHASIGDVATVRSLLLSAESLLTMIFLNEV